MASLQKNVAAQNLTFCLVSASAGGIMTGATVVIKYTQDNGAQTAAGGTTTEKGGGQYNYSPTQAETNCVDIGYLITATTAGATAVPLNMDFHTDPPNFLALAIDSNGNVSTTSNVKKNTASNGNMLIMRSNTTNQPLPGLGTGISATVSIDGAPFVAATNNPTEVGFGVYTHNWAAADTNGNHILFAYTAAATNTSFIEVWTQP